MSEETSSILVRIGFEKPMKHLVTLGPVDLEISKAKELYKALKGAKDVPVAKAEEFSIKLADFVIGLAPEWKNKPVSEVEGE
jgi:hypothetical protein